MEKVSRPLVQSVDTLREDAVDMPHATREIGMRCLDHKMIDDWQRYALLGANCVRLTVLAIGMANP